MHESISKGCARTVRRFIRHLHWRCAGPGFGLSVVALDSRARLRDAYLLQGWAPVDGNSTDVLVKLLSRQRGLSSVPGAEYQYNNGGYLLLGRILERATGQTFGAFADANVFKPLGMTGAYFNGDPVRAAPDHASGYSPQATGGRLARDDSAAEE